MTGPQSALGRLKREGNPPCQGSSETLRISQPRSNVARIQVEPVTFWTGLVLMIVGLIVYPSPFANIYLTTSTYLVTGALLG